MYLYKTRELISLVKDRICRYTWGSKGAHLLNGLRCYPSRRCPESPQFGPYRYYKGEPHYSLYPTDYEVRAKFDFIVENWFKLDEGEEHAVPQYSVKRVGDTVRVRGKKGKIRGLKYYRGFGETLLDKSNADKVLGRAILDTCFLQGLFSLGQSLDLSKALLPDKDAKVRVGCTHMLYDSKSKEWIIWMKH